MMEGSVLEIGQAGGKSMIHRVLQYPAKWEWHVLQQERLQAVSADGLPSRKFKKNNPPPAGGQSDIRLSREMEDQESKLAQIKAALPECTAWLDECKDRRTNQVIVSESLECGPFIYGTVMFQASEQHSDTIPFHFWLSQNKLVTLHDDLRLMIRLQRDTVVARLEGCSSAPEALFVMVSVVLAPFHGGLDEFEYRLGQLESTMRSSNRTGLMDVIFERRYDLLHWSHLFLPIRELHGAAKEAFMELLVENDNFQRVTHRLDRIENLLKHYAFEIDTLISMDGSISSFRGNDIMKTLTIFTVLFTPASVLAAIWGTNFNRLPFDEHKWGFALLCGIVFAVTVLIYIWLWRKGWTGDLLTGRKPNDKHIMGQAESMKISEIFGIKQPQESSADHTSPSTLPKRGSRSSSK
ncbi:magnesium transporter CorA family protein [Paenibacillus gorillae]|uniref:magnesium transporter CorA family protein n=1 Tax=Paenibacillus gorillae TaxID=1243662 RepID=UPI0004B8C6CE|nr:magnesium transporter CorA family protein [Paenibacillus gorillae]